MSIFQGDAVIKTMITLGLEDLKKNPWLIQHIFSDLANIKYLKDQYGQKQIDACQEWIANNNIDIYMRHIRDKDRMPCITISIEPSAEKPEMKHMADQSTDSIILLPSEIGKPIPYIIKPFEPMGYDQSTGEVTIEPGIDIGSVVTGMVLVNPENGQGFNITGINGDSIFIESGLSFAASKLGVLPAYRFYKARIEHSFFQESYHIGCYTHGEPQTAIWLHSIALYSLLRYRESLLEANGFAESVITSSPLRVNEGYSGPGGEEGWHRDINLTGQVRNSWIKSPKRVIESVTAEQKASAGVNASEGFVGGISILSNLNTEVSIDQSLESWITVQDND